MTPAYHPGTRQEPKRYVRRYQRRHIAKGAMSEYGVSPFPANNPLNPDFPDDREPSCT